MSISEIEAISATQTHRLRCERKRLRPRAATQDWEKFDAKFCEACGKRKRWLSAEMCAACWRAEQKRMVSPGRVVALATPDWIIALECGYTPAQYLDFLATRKNPEPPR